MARVDAASKLADLACEMIGLSHDGQKAGYNDGSSKTLAA
jgi:hypothetical protein